MTSVLDLGLSVCRPPPPPPRPPCKVCCCSLEIPGRGLSLCSCPVTSSGVFRVVVEYRQNRVYNVMDFGVIPLAGLLVLFESRRSSPLKLFSSLILETTQALQLLLRRVSTIQEGAVVWFPSNQDFLLLPFLVYSHTSLYIDQGTRLCAATSAISTGKQPPTHPLLTNDQITRYHHLLDITVDTLWPDTKPLPSYGDNRESAHSGSLHTKAALVTTPRTHPTQDVHILGGSNATIHGGGHYWWNRYVCYKYHTGRSHRPCSSQITPPLSWCIRGEQCYNRTSPAPPPLWGSTVVSPLVFPSILSSSPTLLSPPPLLRPRSRLDYRARGCLVDLYNCTNVWVCGLTFTHPPLYALRFAYCQHVIVSNCVFIAPTQNRQGCGMCTACQIDNNRRSTNTQRQTPSTTKTFPSNTCCLLHPHLTNPVAVAPNTDGVVVESSRYVFILHNLFTGGDDCISIKSGWDRYGLLLSKPSEFVFIARNFLHSPRAAAVSVGSEMSGGIREICITNNWMVNCKQGLHVKTAKGRGGLVHDILLNRGDVHIGMPRRNVHKRQRAFIKAIRDVNDFGQGPVNNGDTQDDGGGGSTAGDDEDDDGVLLQLNDCYKGSSRFGTIHKLAAACIRDVKIVKMNVFVYNRKKNTSANNHTQQQCRRRRRQQSQVHNYSNNCPRRCHTNVLCESVLPIIDISTAIQKPSIFTNIRIRGTTFFWG